MIARAAIVLVALDMVDGDGILGHLRTGGARRQERDERDEDDSGAADHGSTSRTQGWRRREVDLAISAENRDVERLRTGITSGARRGVSSPVSNSRVEPMCSGCDLTVAASYTLRLGHCSGLETTRRSTGRP